MYRIFLVIICSIFNFLPFNMREHFYIWDNMFNTNIFRNELIYLTPLLMLPILIPKKIILKKNDFKKALNILKIVSPTIPIIIIKYLFRLKIKSIFLLSIILILFSILLLFYKKKKSDINYWKIFFINLISLIPGVSIFYTFLFSVKNYNIDYKYAIIPYLIESLIYIKPIEINYYVLIALGIGLFTTYVSYIFFRDRKMWKISICSILSAIFYLVFFRK